MLSQHSTEVLRDELGLEPAHLEELRARAII
jgi:hypothetical protein